MVIEAGTGDRGRKPGQGNEQPSGPTSFLEAGSAVAAMSAKVDEASEGVDVTPLSSAESYSVVVIGGGQAGLAMGYHLKRRGVPFVVLDAGERIGERWRQRWNSLRLFTPARFDSLDGMKFPARGNDFPSCNEMADYLAEYAARFELPVRNSVKVDRLVRKGGRFELLAGGRRFVANQVVVAMGLYQQPKIPPFGTELDRSIVQMHSSDYRSPTQLAEGDTLVVGAGNSGAEIAMDLARSDRRVLLSGRFTGQIPFRIDGWMGRMLASLVLRGVFHHVAKTSSPIGRALRSKMLGEGGDALIRVKRKDLEASVVEWVPRVSGVQDGRPRLADGRVLDTKNIIWCTGFDAGLSWVNLPVFSDDGHPNHHRGVSSEPGLYFLGHHFLFAASSGMVQGVSRDARYLARRIARYHGSSVRKAS